MGYLSEKDTTVNVAALSIDKVINMFGTIFNSNGEMIPVPNCEPNGNEWGFGCSYIGQSNVVRVRRNAMENPSTSYSYITLRYTKTTDTAVASGEKIVGQWIDGKPVYEKTIDCGALPNATTKEVLHNITNLNKIVSMYGFCDNGSTFMPLPYVHDQNVANQVGIICNTTKVILLSRGANMSDYNGYVIIRYTKTTD